MCSHPGTQFCWWAQAAKLRSIAAADITAPQRKNTLQAQQGLNAVHLAQMPSSKWCIWPNTVCPKNGLWGEVPKYFVDPTPHVSQGVEA